MQEDKGIRTVIKKIIAEKLPKNKNFVYQISKITSASRRI